MSTEAQSSAQPSGAPPNNQPAGLPQSENILYALLAVLAGGLGVGVYLVRHKLALKAGILKDSACNFNATFNCDAVNMSEQSDLFGLPVSLYAIPTYAVMIFLVWKAIQGVTAGTDDARKDGKVALTAVAGIGLLTCLHAMYLAYISSAVLGAYCLFCMTLYAVNLISTGLAIAAGPKTVGNAISGSIEALTQLAKPVAPAIIVTITAFGIAYIGQDMAGEKFDGMAKQCMEKGLAPTCHSDGTFAGTAAAAGSPAKPAVVAGAENPAKPAVAQPKTAEALPPGKCNPVEYDLANVKVGGKKVEDGWTEFYPPVNSCDFIKGDPNGVVTVVKFADFQCPYCRYLALTMDAVVKEYEGKPVKFVMKNFPMNGRCNPPMATYDKHPNACESSWAGRCAGLQGKFWEMHDEMYANQQSLDEVNLRKHAEKVGLDLAKYDVCMKDPNTQASIKADIQLAYKAGIYGTPRTYINGIMVTGSGSKSIMKYHIDRALKAAEGGPAEKEKKIAEKTDGTTMIKSRTKLGTFFIDAYENSIGKDGKATATPGAVPQRVNWLQAKMACEKAGKRICTEEEWVSACSGEPAEDNNNNGMWGDDDVEGQMYPYGATYQPGNCHDQGDKYAGKALATGSKDQCRTPSAIFDLAGNISEWVGPSKDKATLMGGHSSSGEYAACNQRAFVRGIGNRNATTGFRCCADSDVKSKKYAQSDLQEVVEDLRGRPAPTFSAETKDGKTIDNSFFKGKTTLVNFFASWCGPCKKEMPYLVKYAKQYKNKKFQILGIGVDDDGAASLEFAKTHNVDYPIVTDPDNVLMGTWQVYSMPATFLVDSAGVVKFYSTGFKPEEDAPRLKSRIETLLGK